MKPPVFAALLLLVGGTCAAFLEGSQAAEKTSDRIQVQYWEKWTGEEMVAMKRLVDAFNQSQDRIEVKLLSVSGIADKTLLASSGGNPPDVSGLWADQVVQFADAGALFDMSQLARDAGINREQYIAAYWDMCSYKGGLYAMPTSPGSGAIYVNKALMPEEYNSAAKFPKTIKEFDQFVDRVTKKNPDGSVKVAAFLPREGWGLWNMPYMFGGEFTRGEKINVNGPDDIAAWTWVNTFTKKYGLTETQSFRSSFGNYSSPQNPFLSGKLATYADGPWFSNFIRLYNPSLEWFAVPFPYPDGHPEYAGFSTLNLNTLMIPKGAKHPKEAFQFIAFVQKQANMEQLCMDQFCNSPLRAISTKFLTKHSNKEIALFDQLARSPRAVPPVPLGVRSQIGTEVGNAVDLIDLGKATPQGALDAAQARLDQAWEKYKKQVLGR
jgi:multiple sugar transport system substrate-binding protein